MEGGEDLGTELHSGGHLYHEHDTNTLAPYTHCYYIQLLESMYACNKHHQQYVVAAVKIFVNFVSE